MSPAELLMKLSLASADIEFAKAKCCQAELSRQMGFGDYEKQMALAKEAADRAATHLGDLGD